MFDTITIPVDEFNRLIREANDMGHYGKRVLAVYPLNGTVTSNTAYAWDFDLGPTSTTETWEDR